MHRSSIRMASGIVLLTIASIACSTQEGASAEKWFSDDCHPCGVAIDDGGADDPALAHDAGTNDQAEDATSPQDPRDASPNEGLDASIDRDASTNADASSDDPPLPKCSTDAGQTGLVQRSLLGGRFYTYVPSTYDPKTPLPLVVALHGAGDTAKNYLAYEWQANADARGFIVLAPEGTSAISAGFSWVTADRTRILAALDDVRECYSVAPNKILIQGFSLGADMALFAGLTYADEFVGIAVASGSLRRAETSFNAGAVFLPATKKLRVSLYRGANDPIVTADDVTDSQTRLEADGHTVVVHTFKGPHKTTPADALAQYDELGKP